MRREALYLRDILEAANYISEFIADSGQEGFHNSELVRSAVVQKLAVIGEAAGRISSELRNRYPEVPWARVIAFRNILIHAYFGVDWDIVWRAAKEQAPALGEQIEAILLREFPSFEPR